MTEATPLSLRCDGITSGAIWAFCVDEWGFECCGILKTTSKWRPQFVPLYPFPYPSPVPILSNHIFWHIWTLISFIRPAISRSDPFVGNYYIFNPDLDNGTVTVIFCSWAICCSEADLVTHTLSPLFPIIASLTSPQQQNFCLRHIVT